MSDWAPEWFALLLIDKPVQIGNQVNRPSRYWEPRSAQSPATPAVL